MALHSCTLCLKIPLHQSNHKKNIRKPPNCEIFYKIPDPVLQKTVKVIKNKRSLRKCSQTRVSKGDIATKCICNPGQNLET